MLGIKQRLMLYRVSRGIILNAIILALIPVGFVSADPANYIEYSSPVLDCTAGTVTVQIDYVIQMGYTLSSEETISSPTLGTTTTTFSQIIPTDIEHHGQTKYWGIPPDGSYSYAYTISDLSSAVISATSFIADCTSNTVTVINWNPIPSILPPPSTPGNDMVPIPSHVVQGTFVVTTQALWAPDATAVTPHTMDAGKTVWVYGLDTSGQFYYVMFSGQFFWVPVNTLGPNYDVVWNGTPLPTTTVE